MKDAGWIGQFINSPYRYDRHFPGSDGGGREALDASPARPVLYDASGKRKIGFASGGAR